MTASEDAEAFAKAHKKELLTQICGVDKFPPSEKPFTIFMAGSPGSGKTEFSKNFIKELEQVDPHQKIVRLDTDELRDLLPQYTGTNSDEMQRAATILFDKAYDYIQDHNQSAVIDTTFSSPKSFDNVDRAIKHNRRVGIIYLYQDPLIAWDYTQKREKLEGRTVPKNIFISAYFLAKTNVNKVKQLFGEKIELHLFIKDKDHSFVRKVRFNIKSLDEYLKERYTIAELEKILPDQI